MDAYLESGGKGRMGEVSEVRFSPLSQKWWVHIYVDYSVIYINSSISARIKLKCTSEKWIISTTELLKCSGWECCSQPFTDLTFGLLNPIMSRAWPIGQEIHQLVPQKWIVALQPEACMSSADTFFSCTPITSHNGKPSQVFFVETSITCWFSAPASVPSVILAETLCWAGERWRSRNQLWKVWRERETENGTMDKGVFKIVELPTPSYAPVNQKAVKLCVGRRWHGHKARGTCCWRQLLSLGMNDWKVFRRTGYLQMLQCFSTWILLLVSSDHPSSSKALTPKKTRLLHRKLPGELPVAISISYCSPLTGTKQRELRARGRWLSVERLWETLWKVGVSLANGVACHHVWYFLWF